MGVKNAKKLSKQDLIYKILDQQAVAGESPLKLIHCSNRNAITRNASRT